MARNATPLELFKTNMELGMMLAEAQSVIAMRVMGWGGLWSVTNTENDRMMSEKTEAITKSMQNATLAAMTGKRADEIVNAAVKPLRQKTRANVKRLGKRGPTKMK
ncbi:antifreeze protein [Loktanella sp. M215]|uniref:antifreeze protein n=1 Tax=Loktanella sp. M215 TaxID=2675431 RepID=UPI001F279DE4|nr:antifreeze protein [Loktanella sp. M215]MCF7698421.1 antifreeze protein [Loktanella sp. M215]